MTDAQLMFLIRAKWGIEIDSARKDSPLPASFLGALIANESGGNSGAKRFEPSVYRHLQALAAGTIGGFGSIMYPEIEEYEAEEMANKAFGFHQEHLSLDFTVVHQAAIKAAAQSDLLNFASSWGLTQIMGYQVLTLNSSLADLLYAQTHLEISLRLLMQFAQRWKLNLATDAEALFHCWNSGRPDGKTFDPNYAGKGKERMRLWSIDQTEVT